MADMADEETPIEEPVADADTPEAVEQAPEPAAEPDVEQAPESTADAEPETSAAGEDDDQPPAAPVAPAHRPEPVEVLAPKERRRRKRAAKAPAARGAVSPTERQAERIAERAKKAHARRGERAKDRAAKPAREVVPTAAAERVVGASKARQGIVVSDKAAKTITVRIDTSRRHRRYKKIVRSSKTLHAHDEHNEAHEGDLVRVVETRPLSATKRWRLIEVVERAR